MVESTTQAFGIPQSFKVIPRRVDLSKSVIKHLDAHARRPLRDEQCGQPFADRTRFENVGFEVDVVARATNRVEHGLVRLWTIDEHMRCIAEHERRSDRALDLREMVL